MSRQGSALGLLPDLLHAEGCDGTEEMTCEPVLVPSTDEHMFYGQNGGVKIVVVLMAWCSECGAADWDWV